MEDIIIIADDSEDISDKESTDNNSSITDKKPDSRKLSDDEIKEAENPPHCCGGFSVLVTIV